MTIWLECTSKEAPFGYLGSFTQDRNVLVIKEDGGYIMRTPVYAWDQNLQKRSANFILAEDGKLSGIVKTSFTGLQSENRRDADFSSEVEKETYLKELFPFPRLDMEKYLLDKNVDGQAKKEELAQLVSYGYANFNGPFAQFELNPMNISKRQLKDMPERSNELSIRVGYVDVDSLVYKVPANFSVENLPIQISQSYDFGSYQFIAQQMGEEIHVLRKMVLKEGNYKPESYGDLVSFYKTAYRYDRAKCMLKRKE